MTLLHTREADNLFFKNSDFSSSSIPPEANDLTKTTINPLASSFLHFVNTEDEADVVLEKQRMEQASLARLEG